jgi:pimeloyl-ACP methyl ester carboxylesterase
MPQPQAEPEFINANGRRLAARFQPCANTPPNLDQDPDQTPVIVWLGGFKSDMRGTKAEHLAALAQRQGLAFLRFDYSGHGESGGDFSEGTISRWLEDAEAVISRFTATRRLLPVGSSMGAWIALRLAQNLTSNQQKHRLAGMVLLAPAPDFTADLIEPNLTTAQRADLIAKGYCQEPSLYGAEPYIYTKALLEDGRANRVMTGMIDTHCPVTILQGMADSDVPFAHALKLVSHLPHDHVTLTLIKDGDHRLSRKQDLALLERAVIDLIEA